MMLRILTLLLSVCTSFAALADTGPVSTEKMIEQLNAPKTRSMRNLVVVEAPEPAVPTVQPSLTLMIQFGFNSAKVLAQSQESLANLSVAMQSPQLSSNKFAIEGHTDAKGSAELNRRLSLQRALAVRDFLRTKGVDPERLVAVGKGSSELAIEDQPFAPQNRRVRIVNVD